jgi:hypothetical protein
LENEHRNSTCQLHGVTCEKLDQRFDAMDAAMTLRYAQTDQRFHYMDDALLLRTKELEGRLEGLNQLRQEVVRDRDQYLRKESFDSKVDFYDKWIRVVDEKLTTMQTRSTTIAAVIGFGVTVINIILIVVFHFIGAPKG